MRSIMRRVFACVADFCFKKPGSIAGVITSFAMVGYFRLNFFASLYIVVTSLPANSLRLVFT